MSRPVGPYSPFVVAGEWVATSGQLGTVPAEGGPRLVDGGTGAQLTQALANLAAVLADAGARLDHVVSATVYLTDMADYAQVNRVWSGAFGDHRPARTTVGVAALPLGARVEVAAWAWLPSDLTGPSEG